MKRKSTKSLDIGQGKTCPLEMWVLFDKSNGDPSSNRYLWWFSSREDALEFKRHHVKLKYAAELSKPFLFRADWCIPLRGRGRSYGLNFSKKK